MIDNDMTSILKNFASAGTGEVTDAATGEAKVNTAAQEKNAMKSLLEGLDAQQKSVNQMPGQHTMAKNGAKHPASKYLVGGEFDEELPIEDVAETQDQVDLSKWEKEDVTEEDTNEDTISKPTPPKTQMNKKQSFADIFRSMDETEDDMATRFKKELHDEKSEKALNKGENGKFNLAEEDTGWGDEMIEDLKLLLHDAESYEDLRDGILSTIQQYQA